MSRPGRAPLSTMAPAGHCSGSCSKAAQVCSVLHSVQFWMVFHELQNEEEPGYKEDTS